MEDGTTRLIDLTKLVERAEFIQQVAVDLAPPDRVTLEPIEQVYDMLVSRPGNN